MKSSRALEMGKKATIKRSVDHRKIAQNEPEVHSSQEPPGRLKEKRNKKHLKCNKDFGKKRGMQT